MRAYLAALLLLATTIPASAQFPCGQPAAKVLAFGDSKSAFATYHVYLEEYTRPYHAVAMYELASGGATVASRRATIDSDLTLHNRIYSDIIINLGANDAGGVLVQSTWQANLSYILDALHAKWPDARVYVVGAWRRGFDVNCATLKIWTANVLAARSSWAYAGPDESVFIKAADDGAACTSDGIHWLGPCYQAEALTLAQAMGYHP